MTRVLVTGDVNYDTIIHLEQFPEPRPQTIFSRGFHETLGGTAAGKALALHRLGLKVTLHSLLGDDPPGKTVLRGLKRERLKFVHDPDPLGTQRHVNLINPDGGRISIYVAYQSSEPELDVERLARLIAECDIAVLNISNYCRRLIAPARAYGKPIWCDLHDYDGRDPYYDDFIRAADVLTLSADQLPERYREVMQRLMEQGKELVICTRGQEGLTALTRAGEWIEQAIVPADEVRDPNGAGDSLFAGVLWGRAQGYDVRHCLRIGAITAALTVASNELVHPDLSPAKVRAEYERHFGAPLAEAAERDEG